MEAKKKKTPTIDKKTLLQLLPPEFKALWYEKGYYGEIISNELGHHLYNFLDRGIKDLLICSKILLKIPTTFQKIEEKTILNEFSFITFPVAKAFEGFLKRLAVYKKFSFIDRNGKRRIITAKFLDRDPNFGIGIIFDEKQNPKIVSSLRDKRYRSYPKLISARWDLCRNRIMHYDLARPKLIGNPIEAEKIIQEIYESMRLAYEAYIGRPDLTPLEKIKKLKTRQIGR